MFRPKFARSLRRFPLLALLSLAACASLGSSKWKLRVEGCYQPRAAEVVDWPERLEDFPVAAISWLAVIQQERALTSVERECIEKL